MKQLKFGARTVASAIKLVDKKKAREFENITTLSKAGEEVKAWHAANTFHKKYTEDPSGNFIMALMLGEQKRMANALPYAEAAVKFAPNNTNFLVTLGKLYIELEMFEFAPEVLHRAFALDRSQFQAPLALASYYFKTGQAASALPYCELALEAAPPDQNEAIRLSRAACLMSLGRVAEAESDYRPFLGVPQYRVQTLIALALMRKNDHTSNYAEQVRMELELSGQSARTRSSLYLCLGRLHENGGEYDNAFLNFDMSRKLLNHDLRQSHFPARLVESSAILSPEVFEKFKDFGHPSERPIFVVGMPRSGTTMTEQIIGAHSQVQGVGELLRMLALAKNFSNPGGMRQVLDKMTEVGAERWKDVPGQYLKLLDVLAPGAYRTVDKMPHNFHWLGFIHLCFPNARIIHCKRNPLDCFISSFQNDLGAGHSYTYDQVSYGAYYVNYLRLMDHWNTVLPACSIHELQYEALTANPDVEVRRMLHFLGLPWEEACLNFHERESTVRTVIDASAARRMAVSVRPNFVNIGSAAIFSLASSTSIQD